MKTDRKGRIVPRRGDYRVANFVFHPENNYVKVMCTSGIVSWRVSADLSVGILILQAIKERRDNWLHTYAASIFSQLCVVPDPHFFEKHAALVNAQVEQHPEYYGKQKPDEDKEKDDQILKEEQELHEQTQ